MAPSNGHASPVLHNVRLILLDTRSSAVAMGLAQFDLHGSGGIIVMSRVNNYVNLGGICLMHHNASFQAIQGLYILLAD